MTRRKPFYCPYCGDALERRVFEDRTRGYCDACEEFIFQRPAVTAWTVVVDDRKAVWVNPKDKRANRPWTLPGGFLEVDESAAEGAARELREETNLAVPPDDLELLRTGFHMDDPAEGSLLSICFWVLRTHVSGPLRASNEIDAVRSCRLAAFEPPERVQSVDECRYRAALRQCDEHR